MGAFNILTLQMNCNNCASPFTHRLQFKFGEVWQHEYKQGDKIKRGDPYYDIGKPELPRVKVYGCLENENCPYCGHKNAWEYDIIIEHDIIKRAMPLSDLDKYTKDTDYKYFIDE